MQTFFQYSCISRLFISTNVAFTPILQRCQSAFKQQTLEVLKHVDWKHARSSVSYIQPSCRGPWKQRAEVGVMKRGERGHSAPRRCPLTLRWSLSHCWGYIQHFNVLPVVETSQKGSRDQQNLLGFCGLLTVLFLARRLMLRKGEERGYGCFLMSHSISCFVKERVHKKKKENSVSI